MGVGTGPRRYGKTSLLNRLGEALTREGWNVVYVDFFGVLTLADVSARVERAYATQLQGSVAAWFAGFRRRLRPSLRIGADDTLGTIYFDRLFDMDETLDGIESVTPEDVQRVAIDLFRSGSLSATVLGNVNGLQIPRERLDVG